VPAVGDRCPLLALLSAACLLWPRAGAASGPDIESASPADVRAVEPTVAAPAPAPARAKLDVRDVGDLETLAHLVEADAVVHRLARRLVIDHERGVGVIVAASMAGAIVLFGSMAFWARHECSPDTGGCGYSTNWPLFTFGASTMLLGGAVGFSLLPERRQVREVVDLWNTGHPAAPLTIEGAGN
jgi:hypothetical protein